MIKIKIRKGEFDIELKGETLEVANEAVDVAIAVVDHFERVDFGTAQIVRETMIKELEKRARRREEPEVK